MFGGNRLVRLFSTGKQTILDFLLLPGPFNVAGNTKEYQIINFMERKNEIILRLKRQQFWGINPSIIANLRGISSSASFSSALGFLSPQIGYSNLHVRKFMDPLCEKPWKPTKPYIVEACNEITKAVWLNDGKLTYKKGVLDDLIRFLEDLLRQLKNRKALIQ